MTLKCLPPRVDSGNLHALKEKGPLVSEGAPRDLLSWRARVDSNHRPNPYRGIALSISFGNEDDFGPAKTKILCFGRTSSLNDEDHWALRGLKSILERHGNTTFVYSTKDFPREVLIKSGCDQVPTVILDAAEFETALRRDLKTAKSRIQEEIAHEEKA